MAEINKITVFSNASGIQKEALVDDQRRVVVSIDKQFPVDFVSGTSGSIAAGSFFTVVSYTVPVGKTLSITGWTATGQAAGIFTLYVDGSPKIYHRNSIAFPDVGDQFGGVKVLVAGQIIEIKVKHFELVTAIFAGTLFGYEV